MKYIAYCRKSRDEADKQVLSIEAQIAEIKEYAKREKIEIVEFIEEAKTAKIPGREKFAQVIKKIEKGEAQGIIAWHPDRLARNSIDGGRIIYLLDIGKLLDLKFPTQRFENSPQGKFMLNIAFGQSKYYVDNLSENVKRGIRQKIRNGVWPLRAPLGYYNEPRLRTVEIDKEKAPIIEKAYGYFLKEDKTFTNVALFLEENKITKRSGKPLNIDQVKFMLSNKFYIGIMRINNEYHAGAHKLFISKELFQKVQKKIDSLKWNKRQKYKFPLMGLIKCGECGASITAEAHTKYYRTKNRKVTYVYYRCTKKIKACSQGYIPAPELEKELRNIIDDVALPDKWGCQWLEWLTRDEKEELKSVDKNKEKLQENLKNLNTKQNFLLESFLDQIIDAETYKQKKNEIFEKKLKLEEEISKLEEGTSGWLEPMREFINTALQCKKIARAKNTGEDLAIFAKTVGSNFFLKNRRLSAEFKKGFDTLRASGGARSLFSRRASHSFQVAITERSANLL